MLSVFFYNRFFEFNNYVNDEERFLLLNKKTNFCLAKKMIKLLFAVLWDRRLF